MKYFIIVIEKQIEDMHINCFNSFFASGDLLSADNLCQQFGTRSGPSETTCAVLVGAIMRNNSVKLF